MSGRATYPAAEKVRSFVQLARELGLDVAGFEVCRDGTIRVVESRAVPSPANDFDRFKDQL